MVDIADIVGGLTQRIQSLAAELLPAGRREGDEWVDAHRDRGGLGDSMKVKILGPRAGIWAHYAAGADARAGTAGDALDLVAYVLFDGNKKSAVAWAKTWLGLDESSSGAVLQGRPAPQTRRALPPPKSIGDPDAGAKEDAEKRAGARRIFFAARPSILDTPVDRYLLGRGLDVRLLARPVHSLRFHDRLWHMDSQRPWPAMVACLVGADNQIAAVHRTWLEVRPDGRVVKASVNNNKMTLGRPKGLAIRLTRGASGKPLAEAPETDTIAITEGIEDGLTIALAKPEWRVLVAGALPWMRSIALPEHLKDIVIVADNDEAEAARKALDAAIAAFRGQGRRVRVARAPGAKDFNELLTKTA